MPPPQTVKTPLFCIKQDRGVLRFEAHAGSGVRLL